MGMQVEVKAFPELELTVVIQRALLRAGAAVIAVSNAQAPYEDVARHGYHMRDSTYVRLLSDALDAEAVEIGYEAFWSLWQHEDLEYHHTVGHAKFLELACAEMEPVVVGIIEAAVAEALGAAA